MIARLEKELKTADLAALEQLISELPEDDVLGRVGLESRRDEVKESILLLDAHDDDDARTVLLFGGGPVIGSRGVEADFASQALSTYEDLVTKVWGFQQRGELARSGPVPDRRGATLHITNIVHGSFGFELSELQGVSPVVGGSNLKEAMSVATSALVAAGKGDGELAEAVEDLDARAFGALREFFAVLKRARATIRIVAADTDETFDQRAIEQAAERTEASREEEENVPVSGTFLAVLPEGRRFEFQLADGKTLRGSVARALTTAQLREMNARWGGKHCIAHMRRVSLTRGGRTQTRHILRAIDGAAEAKPEA